MAERGVRLVLADVDGTLVTNDKQLSRSTVAAVDSLREAGIELAVTSGRPPRGMSMLVEPLALSTPLAAFNGGTLVRPDMSIILQREIPHSIVGQVESLMDTRGLEVWVYSGSEWYVRDGQGPHVDRESQTVRFAPKIVQSHQELTDPIVKIVGVSDDPETMAEAEAAVRDALDREVSVARSQPYYLDVTHPDANKGSVIRFLSHEMDIPLENVASIGDMPNDVLMFAHSGISIAMGNATREVRRAARFVTTSNEEEGFARAMERFVLQG